MPLNNLNVSPEEQTQLTKAIRDAFNNKKLDWNERLRTLWRAEWKLVEDYGHEGLMMLIDDKTQVYVDGGPNRSLDIMHISDVPEKCPWYALRELPLKEIIEQVWKPFAIGLVDDLTECTKDLFVIHEGKHWYLVYAYVTRDYNNVDYYDFFAGRESDPKAKLSKKLLDAGWKMPEDLKDFYEVHGTFGSMEAVLRNDDTHAISSAEKLEASLTFLEQYQEEWGAEYSFFDLLPFFEDGAGNSQNFYKADPVGNSYATVDWDHETKEISGGSMFEEFLDYHFGNTLKGS